MYYASMGFRQAISDFFAMPARKNFSNPPGPLSAAISAGFAGTSGVKVDRTVALSVPAVQRGRNMLCSIATLPLVQLNSDNETVDNPLFRQLDPDVPNVVTLSQTVEDLVFEGISWWEITAHDFSGFPTSVRHLDVGAVSLQPPADGRNRAPLPSGEDPRGAVVYVDGRPVAASRVIRFDSPNPGVLKVCGRAVRRALALDLAAEVYANDPKPLDFFSPTENAEEASDEDVQDILSKWETMRKRRATAYVPRAMKYNSVDSPSPADLQLVELQRQVSLEIANAFGVDPEDLGVSTTSRTYANVIDRRRDRINDVLSPYMRAITDRLSMGDVTRRGHRVQFVLDDYLKSNPTERVSVQKEYLAMGVISVEEIRSAEGLPPGAPQPAPVPEPVPTEASAVPQMSFAATDMTFGAEVTGFAVDRETRTITGTLMPYNRYGSKGGMRFRFTKGALKWSDPGRVKLLVNHDVARAIGFAKSLKDTPQGLVATFKVGRGQAGDEALALAEDGVLDGLSAGTEFDFSTDVVVDPKDKSAWLVTNAALREGSLTALPAFDDARLTSVNASLSNEGNEMPDTTEPTTAAPAVVPATFDAATVAALLAAVNQNQPLGIQQLATEPERPALVNPTRTTATAFVSDPAPYRFDRKGNLLPGSHEFSRDLFAALDRDTGSVLDQGAYNRALSFVQAQFDVITTDINELNPTRNRPDMYVDQRSFRYPVWDAINKGTLSDITPFTFPKFSSAADLVAAHTEGQEPSSGTFVTTSATVTPTALSGKAKVSREVWDQGGNPQIGNLIWRQMLKGWFEALEAAAVAVLDAASPTQIDFSGTPGLANDDLDQAITAAFASLQFVRGGFSMDSMYVQIDLYKALVAATGTDGRRLYPALGPTNASGTVRPRFGALDINGVVALPAWALAATGTVAASSYLFDSESVHGWASAPQRLTIDRTEVANIYIGIFGYKATVISDINGVREIVYDPA